MPGAPSCSNACWQACTRSCRPEACSAAEKHAGKGYGCLLIMLGPGPGCRVPLLTPSTAHVHPPSAPLISRRSGLNSQPSPVASCSTGPQRRGTVYPHWLGWQSRVNPVPVCSRLRFPSRHQWDGSWLLAHFPRQDSEAGGEEIYGAPFRVIGMP